MDRPKRSLRPTKVVLMVLAASGLVLTGLAPASGAAPAIRLRPAVGPPTTEAGVWGLGFGPSETVDLAFDSSVVATASTGPGGSFKAKVPVPATALPGRHEVLATGEASGLEARATFLVRTNWTKFHFDLANTGFNPYENVLSPATVGGLALQWKVRAPGSILGDPAVVGGVVYAGVAAAAGSSDGYIVAARATTGRVLWIFNAPSGDLPTEIAVADGVVYVCFLLDHALYALDAATGQQLWVTPGPTRTPAVADGVVYAGSVLGGLYALDARDGAILWKAATGPIVTAPAVVDGVVYGGSNDDNVYAVDAVSGDVIWAHKTRGDVKSPPAVSHGVVYVGSNDGSVYALDAASGARVWRTATGAQVESGPAVAYGAVYVGSVDHNLYAFDARTGAELWNAPVGDIITGQSPAVANGVVYQGSNDHSVYAFDATTGAQLWSYQTGDVIGTSAAVVNGWLYVGSLDDKLYAFHLPR